VNAALAVLEAHTVEDYSDEYDDASLLCHCRFVARGSDLHDAGDAHRSHVAEHLNRVTPPVTPSPANPVIRYAEMPGGPEFDEFIAKGADIHIEAMGDAQWWIGVKVGDRMWHINVGAKSPRAKGYAICEEDE